MDFNFDRKTLRNPWLWVVVVPVVFTIWTLVVTVSMFGYRSDALSKQNTCRVVQKHTRDIMDIRREMGDAALANNSSNNFQGIISARACAKVARISENRLFRAEGSRPRLQSDGSWLHSETYKLNNVRLLQIVQFIDHAERNFYALTCEQLSITPIPRKIKDAWDAGIKIQYRKK